MIKLSFCRLCCRAGRIFGGKRITTCSGKRYCRHTHRGVFIECKSPGLTMGENWKARRRADLLRQMSYSFLVDCISSLRFIFGINVLQPKFSVDTRT